MTDYETLKSIEHIAPNNLFLQYIIDRVQDDDYRGIQCSQHNRLTYDYFKSLLQLIYHIAGEEKFRIHVGDDTGERQIGAETYYQIVAAIKKEVGKGTINSVKKNTFPDLARAGLLNRYDKNGTLIIENISPDENKPTHKRSSVSFVSLSNLGLRFAQAVTEFQRRKYYTDAVDALTKSTASDLVELLSTDNRFDNINIHEFMYILSNDRQNILYNNKLLLLTEYRKLSVEQKDKLNKLLQQYCDPNKPTYSKREARDYSNWKNESLQIFGLLSNSTYFKLVNDNLILNNGEFGLFVQSAKRSQKPKDEYFEYHKVSRKQQYEMHHIVPFMRAKNQHDAQFIDDKRNLIYLSPQKHAEFTAKKNVNILTKYSKPTILFLQLDTTEQFISVNIDSQDALLSANRIKDMVEYNQLLLQKFYHDGE